MTPREVDELTVGEYAALSEYAVEWTEAQRAAARG